MIINKTNIHKILLITLSNLGDIILTTPVLEKLYDEFPGAEITVITGPAGMDIFTQHPAVKDVRTHIKKASITARVRQAMEIRREKFDIVVDLKNSLIPYFSGAKISSRMSFGHWGAVRHKRDEHLEKLSTLMERPFRNSRFFMPSGAEDRKFVSAVLGEEWVRCVLLNPGAKSHLKRWDAKKFARLADMIVGELACRVLIVGTDSDRSVVDEVKGQMTTSFIDLCGRTTIGALAELMRRSDLVVTNDSAPLHVASAVNTPTVAIFGPTDERRYGPLSVKSRVVKPSVPCRPCGRALCSTGPDEGCISQISVNEVFRAAKELLGSNV
ncbi:MAG: glycosyltransferase family 9 protein [Candidatus Omnitrophica bacterium]|nr:glycosyltransferase family 9 protein [Candidatus Omnitrophota bacterium]